MGVSACFIGRCSLFCQCSVGIIMRKSQHNKNYFFGTIVLYRATGGQFCVNMALPLAHRHSPPLRNHHRALMKRNV